MTDPNAKQSPKPLSEGGKQRIVGEMLEKHLITNINQIMQHFLESTEFSCELEEVTAPIIDYEELAKDNGWFMSDGEIYFKDELEAFPSIEEGCKHLGMREVVDQVDQQTCIYNPQEECHFDDWSDAAEAGYTMVKEEDGSGSWFIVSFFHNSFSEWSDCCSSLSLEGISEEIYEYWVVDSWLGPKLKSKNETVFSFMDFTGNTQIWGRRTTGQSPMIDCVMHEIADEAGLFGKGNGK